MRHIVACLCGAETPCEAVDQQYGAVWQCPACGVVTAAVYPKGGGKMWITIALNEVAFHQLLDTPEDECGPSWPGGSGQQIKV